MALSGGVDSVALLHALADSRRVLARRLVAFHVNHGLVEEADEWQEFCGGLCEGFGIPYEGLSVSVVNSGAGLEAAARKARYNAIQSRMRAEDVVITAHHADDQAETLLLQAVRGAGPHGLSAMATLRPFGPGWLARPLLDLCRADITRYAAQQGLRWVDDSSNRSAEFTRNRVRRDILPLLASLGHGGTRALARSARLQAQSAGLLDEVAAEDMKMASGRYGAVLCCEHLLSLSVSRRRNLIRFWLRQRGVPMLHEAQMDTLDRDILGAGKDRQPELRWAGVVLRRFRAELSLHRDGEIAAPRDDELRFLPPRDLVLPVGWLRARAVIGDGIKQGLDYSVRFRRGGEALRPVGDSHCRSVKYLFQRHHVPPWRRSIVPLLFADDRLAAIPGICIAHEFAAAQGEPAWQVEWLEQRR